MKTNLWMAMAAGAFLLAGCEGKGKKTAAAQAADEAMTVRAAPAAERLFERRITVQGNLQAKHFANVAARIGGNIEVMNVDAGDRVEAGKTELFQTDPVSLQNAVIAAEQQLNVAKAGLEVSRVARDKAAKDFARFGRLHGEGRVSDNEFERVQVAAEQSAAHFALSEAQVSQAAASLGISRKNLSDSKIFAPISGFVTVRLHERGEQVGPGTVILRVEDPDYIEVSAFLPAQYYAEVEPGKSEARIVVSGRDAGKVTLDYRGPAINPLLRTFEVKGRVPAGAGVVSGAMADLTIVFASRKSIGVPDSAILVRGGKEVVFVTKDGKAAQREVATGIRNDGFTEITKGLAAGDPVIVEGQTLVNDGLTVRVLSQAK